MCASALPHRGSHIVSQKNSGGASDIIVTLISGTVLSDRGYVSPLCSAIVVLHNENMYCVSSDQPRSLYINITWLCLALMTDVTYVYVMRVNAHDPNGLHHSLFTARIKLFAVKSSCPHLTLKAWFTMGFLHIPHKHDNTIRCILHACIYHDQTV